MTVAVCIRCGEMKVGAFTSCQSCRFAPKLPEELAKSLLVSDQVTGCAELDKASERLKAGYQLEFDSKMVAELAATIHTSAEAMRIPLGCVLLGYAPVVIMVLLFITLLVVIALLKWKVV